MVLAALQVVGFSLGVLSWVGMIGTCASPEWRKNSQGERVIPGMNVMPSYEGLWARCIIHTAGQTLCDNNFSEMKGILQICRGLLVSAIVFGFVALFVTILGLNCVTIGRGNNVTKRRVAMSGGLLFGIGGILTGGAVSYYAHQEQEYYYPLPPGQPSQLRYEYGHALFIGWATLVLGLLSAIILTSINFAIASENRDSNKMMIPPSRGHNYQPVSILQRIPQPTGAIAMNTINSDVSQVPRGEMRIDRISTKQTNGFHHSSTASSSGHQYYKSNSFDRVQRASSERPSKNLRKNTEKLTKKSVKTHHKSVPSTGPVRSVSGTLKEYL